MATLNDLFHYWGNDLVTSGSGDLLTVSGLTRSQQRILRRLLTNRGDYLGHPEYGAGLPSFLGQPIDKQKIQAAILAQMLLEDSVGRTPAPVITVTQGTADNTAFTVSIVYFDTETNALVTLSFNVGI